MIKSMSTPPATGGLRFLINITANSGGHYLKEDYVQNELAAAAAVPIGPCN